MTLIQGIFYMFTLKILCAFACKGNMGKPDHEKMESASEIQNVRWIIASTRIKMFQQKCGGIALLCVCKCFLCARQWVSMKHFNILTFRTLKRLHFTKVEDRRCTLFMTTNTHTHGYIYAQKYIPSSLDIKGYFQMFATLREIFVRSHIKRIPLAKLS